MIGQTIGKYRVESRIGRGGMGTVYRAVDETLHREVAIKVLNSELNDPEVAKRFRAEAITVARLSHPGIATIYELFEHDGQWLMVMEFVKGETLERLVERAGPLTAERAAELAIQALGALGHAHSLGVVHRDLKPANLMLTEAGSVKIMDFGIARVSGSEHLTNAGFMMGTPAYMAPEQVLSQEVDSRADLYAIGVVIYRITTGRLPFKGETPFALAQSQVNDPPTPIRTARQGLPDWLELVIGKALAKSPGDRFQTAEEFQAVLQRCLAGLPVITQVDATAETGMMLTPPALRSGAVASQTPLGQRSPTGTIPLSTGTSPVPAATPSGRMRMPTVEEMPTQLHPTAGIAVATGAQAAATMPTGAQPSGAKNEKKTSSTGLIAGAAAAVIVVGIGAAYMWSQRHPAQPAAAPVSTEASSPPGAAPPASNPDPAAAAPAAPAPTTPPATPDQTAAGPPASADASKGTTTAGAPGTRGADASAAAAAKPKADAATNGATPSGTRGVTPASPASGRSNAASSTSPAGATPPVTPPAATAPAQPPIDDSFVTYKDIKFMAVKGDDSQDQDALVNFGGGQITVVPKDGGAAFASVPYATIAHATYSHSKDPKWDGSLPAPPDNLNIHGFLRGTRHWLMLQSKTAFVLLRLDDNNFRAVLDTIENRCRLKVDRMPEGGH